MEVVKCHITMITGNTIAQPSIPANTKRLPNAGLMMGQRRRRWHNIKQALGDRLVFAGIYPDMCRTRYQIRYLFTGNEILIQRRILEEMGEHTNVWQDNAQQIITQIPISFPVLHTTLLAEMSFSLLAIILVVL